MELLVVVSLIALLTAVLVPSITQSVRLANDTICKVHLREISHALSVYQMDNEGWLPVPTWEKRNYYLPPVEDPWYTKLFPNYLVDPKVLTCPEDPMGFRMPSAPKDMTDPRVADSISYGINGFIATAASGALADSTRFSPRRPQDTILLADLGPDYRQSKVEENGAPHETSPSASLLSLDDGFDPFAGKRSRTWLTTRHRVGINVMTPAWSVREARTRNLIHAPIRRYYARCAAGGCTLCNDLTVFHYSFAQDQLYWWTGPAPSEF